VTTPLPTREELGIREVDTAEAFEAAGLTHVRYEAGEQVPWAPGLFFLHVESGAVEGWVHGLELRVSPSNRFIGRRGLLYDRATDRAYAWDALRFARSWGTGDSERLLFWASSLDAYVLLDGDLQPVVQLRLPSGEHFTNRSGGYMLVRDHLSSQTFHLVNFADETHPRVHTWVLPWELTSSREAAQPRYRIELLDDLVAFVGPEGDAACRVTRYDLEGALLSDRIFPCAFHAWSQNADSLPRISPDGTLIAAATFGGALEHDYGKGSVGAVLSVFDAATGAEVLRLLGAHPSWIQSEYGSVGNVWLADSSGIIVDTSLGRRVAGRDGVWRPAHGWASPDDPDLFLKYADAYARCPLSLLTTMGTCRRASRLVLRAHRFLIGLIA
jgi:hypothetical protein